MCPLLNVGFSVLALLSDPSDIAHVRLDFTNTNVCKNRAAHKGKIGQPTLQNRAAK